MHGLRSQEREAGGAGSIPSGVLMPASIAPHPFAVVTGASSGIGLALATTFAENGFDLLVTAEDDGVQTAAAELGRSASPPGPSRPNTKR